MVTFSVSKYFLKRNDKEAVKYGLCKQARCSKFYAWVTNMTICRQSIISIILDYKIIFTAGWVKLLRNLMILGDDTRKYYFVRLYFIKFN